MSAGAPDSSGLAGTTPAPSSGSMSGGPSSAPITAASAALEPITSAPITSAPILSAPITSAPITSAPITPAPSTPAPNSGYPRIDKYELIEEIGHGGMATVYRARDPRLGREVAVKVIHKHLRENPEVGTRFVAEARAAAKLRHPNIVDVFDVSSDDDPERYLVVELIRGTTLRKVLQQHRDMPAEIGAAIVLRVCSALTHAHASSIIHRDIKPENVLVELPSDRAAVAALHDSPSTPRPPAAAPSTPRASSLTPRAAPVELGPSDTQQSIADVVTPRGVRGAGDGHKPRSEPRAPPPKPRDDAGVVIKLTDFGIAKILDAAGVTSTGQVLGSPAHMAPEQIEGGDVDARTDVFALGVLMYECLVGHLPFEGKNPAQVLRRVLEGTYPAADRERPSVGGRWSRILARALARDAAERTASAAELGEAIERELGALDIGDPRAEVAAYFEDPHAYAEALASRLVPKLVARGEAARRAGDIPGAAADFNRALALHPDDLAILKRIGNLTSSAGRRQLMRRAGAIVLGSAVLGLAAFQISRAWKASAARRDPPALSSANTPDGASARAMREPPKASADIVAVAPSGSSPIEPIKRPRIAATPSFTPAPPPPAAPGARMVHFVVNPKGAKLAVDGAPRSAFLPFSLPVGAHQVEVTPIVESCCKKLSTTVLVEAPPSGAPETVQQIPLTMEIRPADVTLAGAPPNGQISCPDLNLRCFAGGSKQVKLREPTWTGSCAFSAPDKPSRNGRVTISAGVVNAVNWQGD